MPSWRWEHERGREAIAPTLIEIALAQPTWHEQHLLRLLKERLGRTELAAAVLAVRLSATKVQAAAPPTEILFPEPGGCAEDHHRLLELLVARLGAEGVLRPAPLPTTGPNTPTDGCRCTIQKRSRRHRWICLALPGCSKSPIQLMMKNHRPFYGSPLKLVSTGERIETGWFDGALASRDYFVAQASDRSCYWIYRERPSIKDADATRWFLHGLFG